MICQPKLSIPKFEVRLHHHILPLFRLSRSRKVCSPTIDFFILGIIVMCCGDMVECLGTETIDGPIWKKREKGRVFQGRERLESGLDDLITQGRSTI